jgi:hypothetical protein
VGSSSRTCKVAAVEIWASFEPCEIQSQSIPLDTNLAVHPRDRRGHVCYHPQATHLQGAYLVWVGLVSVRLMRTPISHDCLRLVQRYGYPSMSEIPGQPPADPRRLMDLEVLVPLNPAYIAWTDLDEGYFVCSRRLQGPSKSRPMAYFEVLVASVSLVPPGTLETQGRYQQLYMIDRKGRIYNTLKNSSSSSAVGRLPGSWSQHLWMSSHNPSLFRVSGR